MSSSEIGRKIGKFTFVRELGEGGMGKVFLARQESLDRNVAIKILHSDLARDDVFLQRFHREAKAAAVFQHPNVVGVIDADQDEETGDHYICFEFVDGSSLEDMIKLQPLTEKRTIEVARAVAEALEYASSKGIVHRDVKPDNILIDKNGVPKLADLGLAKTVDARAPAVTQPGMIVGTPLYMAPEQALGYEEVDVRADLYSLGLVMWRMVTGKVPFDEEGDISSLHVLSRHINEDLPPVQEHAEQSVTDELAKVIHWASARDRNDRYPTARAMAADLMRLENHMPPLGPLGENAQRTVSMPADDVRSAAPPAETPPPAKAPVEKPERDRSTDTPPQTPAAVVVPKPSGKVNKDSTPAWAPPSDISKPPVSVPVLALVVGLLVLGLGLVAATRKDPEAIAKVVDGTTAPTPTLEVSSAAPSPSPTVAPTLEPTPSETPEPTRPPPVVEDPPPDPTPTPTATPSPRPTPSKTPDPPPVKPPGARGIDLADEAKVVEHVEATTRDLLGDVVSGRRRFQQILWSDGWKEDRALKRYVAGTRHAIAILRPDSSELVRRASRAALAAMIRVQKRAPLPGRVAAVVDRSIETWAAVGQALERIRLALRDPRGGERAVGGLSKRLGQGHPFTEQVAALIELTEAADWNQDWSQSPQRRVGVARRQQAIAKRLGGTALAEVFAPELKVVHHIVHVILRDNDRSVLNAIEQLDPGARTRSRYLQGRRQSVPARAALAKLPARGLRLELASQWGRGQIRVIVDNGPDLIFDGSGLLAGSRAAIIWGTPPVILIEPQGNQNLILLPGSRPYKLTRQRLRSGRGLPRFTVRPRGVELKQVQLLQLPPRGAQRPPGTRWAGSKR